MITEFSGRWTYLSNFALCSVWFEGHMYGSVEHAYQAAKTLGEDQRRRIRHLPTPNQAKKAGRWVTLRPDWKDVKVPIMKRLLQEKFAQEPGRTILLSTEGAKLIEGNWWGDQFWGQSPLGCGQNMLGTLLMEVRAELQEGRL
jgi:ribA/ribD-fused uncharacterized protein